MDPHSELELMHRTLGKLVSPLSGEEVLSYALQDLKDSYDCLAVAIVAFDGEGRFHVAISKGWSNEFAKRFAASPFEGLVRDMAVGEGAVRIAAGDPRHQAPGYRFEHPYQAMLAVPMGVRGRRTGFLYLSGRRADAFTAPTVLSALDALAALFALVLDHSRQCDRVAAMADIDPLTGLSSYKRWHEELHREVVRVEAGSSAVAMFEAHLNHFKEYNGVHGHLKGDRLLMEMSRTARAALGPLDVLCRVGAKWYAVLPGCTSADARRVADTVLAAMKGCLPTAQPALTVSIGLSSHLRGEKEAQLISRVEEAAQEARRHGGTAVHVL